MKYIVFEAGSRAGFSAEMFFRAWKKNHPEKNVELILADADPVYCKIPSAEGISRVNESVGISIAIHHSPSSVFPGDELTRQRNWGLQDHIANDKFASVMPSFYDKAHINRMLASVIDRNGLDCPIRIPKTFDSKKVCIKPNTLSAGSKDIQFRDNVCVSELIDIDKEYVVDIMEKNGRYLIFARETILRCGYDKMIRLLPHSHRLISSVVKFLRLDGMDVMKPMFSGIFHLQVAEDHDGSFYFIEASKRISGTSIVNVFRGFNPFDLLEETKPQKYDVKFKEDEWYRYEDFVQALNEIM